MLLLLALLVLVVWGNNEVPLRSYNAVQKIGGHALDNVKLQSTPTNLSNQRIQNGGH